MFCNKCGQEYNEGIEFCSKCGNSFSGNISANQKINSTITISVKKSHWYEILMPKLHVEIDGVHYKIKMKKSITLEVVPGQHKVDMYFKRRLVLFIPLRGGKKQLSVGVRDGEDWKIDYRYPFFMMFQKGKVTAVK